MEYRLNKIDTDARRKVLETTKNGKIHKGGNLEKIKKDKENIKKEKKESNHRRMYITVDGKKNIGKNIEIDGELEVNKENSIGTILDKKG
ncbi:MAG: hypothetical protein ACRC28_12285 [Clostridium sp.]|uniref:hypothetical protein n=1 Tax=Clostridium sp. TaxID=1506 RepID=UPI003F2C6242